MMPEFIYLHGFASSPKSRKAEFFQKRLAGWGVRLRVPDLNTPDFSSLTLTSMIGRLEQEMQACSPSPVNIIASSLGALVALHFVARFKQREASRVAKMLYLAPSLHFAQNRLRQMGRDAFDEWRAKGWYRFTHYSSGRQYRVSYRLIDDIIKYDSPPAEVGVPILVYHGRRDENVDYRQSVEFAAKSRGVTLRLMESDHTLLDQLDRIWSSAVQFFDLCGAYTSGRQNKILIYNLADDASAARFKPYEDKFLNLLEEAYGNKFYGNELHLDRIYGRGHSFGAHRVFLAFSGGTEVNHVVGCSYIRPDGKRGATAVSPEHQGRSTGRQLICASLNLFDSQFTEISPSDSRMHHLLTSVGFQAVTTEVELRRHLGKAAHLLRSVSRRDARLLYRRSIPACQGVERQLVMYEYRRESF